MKKLILLTGLHKTGTTSIQTACANNLEALRASGFLFPVMRMQNNDGSFSKHVNHSTLLTPIFKKKSLSSFYRSPQPDEIRAYEVARKHRRDTFKNFLEANQADLLLIAEECSLLAPDELLDLKDFFNALHFEVQVYCCIRSPSSWLTSMVVQQVMGKRSQRLIITKLIESFVISGEVIVPRIQKIIAAFPDTKFYSFNSAVSPKAGPAGYFLSLLGIDLGKNFSSIRENVGGSDHAVRVNNKINEYLGNRYQFKDNDSFYTALPLKCPALFEIPGNKFALREGEAATLLPYLIKENEWLKNTFGAGFYEEEIRFSNDPVMLDDETRQFLMDNFTSAEQPVKQIVERYLSEH
jgi:hypothetical protein